MGDFLTSVLALIVTLGVLITFHEFGHFWVAKRFGVKVLRFSVGFGRPIWLRRSKTDDTEFVITAIPLGGYVKMLDEREGEVAAEEQHRAFNRQPLHARFAIVAAGPVFNFIFAILAYTLMFAVGTPGTRPLLGDPLPDSIAAHAGFQKGDLIVAIDNELTPTLDTVLLNLIERSMDGEIVPIQVENRDGDKLWRSLDLSDAQGIAEDGRLLENLGFSLWPIPVIIGHMVDAGPAQRAGLKADDLILAIDDKPIENWSQLVSYVRERPNQQLTVLVERDGQQQRFALVTDAIEEETETIGRIGIGAKMPDDLVDTVRVTVRYGPLDSIAQAITKTWDMSLFTLRMLGRMLIGRASLENISGPITIAQFAGQSASIGWAPFLNFLALVSISLGVLNLLPIPVLDGGHLLYYCIEFVKGGPLSEAAQYLGQRVGLVLLAMLMSLAIFNDLVRLFE